MNYLTTFQKKNDFFKIYIYLYLFFLEKMEEVIEKISLVSDKIDIIELYSVGEKIHDVLNQCNQDCRCLQYLTDLKNLVDSINTNELVNQKIIFEEASIKNSNSILHYDQINKNFVVKFLSYFKNCSKF